MAHNSRDHSFHDDKEPVTIAAFPQSCYWQTAEQVRGFELLRLAIFALKLRKLEHLQKVKGPTQQKEHNFRCNLLRHVIFQQVLILTELGAREQAFQLIRACRRPEL